MYAARAALLSRQLSRQRCHVTNVPCETAAPTGQTAGPSATAAASGDGGVCTGTAVPSGLLPPPLQHSRSEPKDVLTAEPQESRSPVSNLKVGFLENPTSTTLSDSTLQRQMQKSGSFSRVTAISQGPSDDVAEPAGPKPQYGIPRANVGFKLLQKAGWKEGTGLGRDEQGLQMPLEKSSQVGRQGLGKPQTSGIKRRQGQQQQESTTSSALQGQQKLDEQAKHKAKLGQVALPEDSETFVARVKRHRQRQLAEEQEVKKKSISRYINRAFRDDVGPSSADNNPLTRSNRLTATNPLL